MKTRTLISAYFLLILTYIIVYDILILSVYHPDLSFMQWVLKPAIDMYSLEPFAYIVFLATSIAFLAFFKGLEKKVKLKELRIVGDKCDEGRDFHYAISILKDTRFSYVLGQNPSIELNGLKYLYYNLKYIKLSLDLF